VHEWVGHNILTVSTVKVLFDRFELTGCKIGRI